VLIVCLLNPLFFSNPLFRVSFSLLSPKLQGPKIMYLIVIAWLYVTLLMALAEAFSTQGSVLGAIITFVFYGLLPMALVVYLMGTPLRRKAIRRQDEQARQEFLSSQTESAAQPDAGRHAAALPEAAAVPAVGKEER
jgi:Na+-transporting methylmalonyl-CoA/oxaloacetate decarboxylase gamma subunit